MPRSKTKEKTKAPAGLDETRRKAVEEAAYYRWLNRGGQGDDPVNDWLGAEQEVLQNVFDREAAP